MCYTKYIKVFLSFLFSLLCIPSKGNAWSIFIFYYFALPQWTKCDKELIWARPLELPKEQWATLWLLKCQHLDAMTSFSKTIQSKWKLPCDIKKSRIRMTESQIDRHKALSFSLYYEPTMCCVCVSLPNKNNFPKQWNGFKFKLYL